MIQDRSIWAERERAFWKFSFEFVCFFWVLIRQGMSLAMNDSKGGAEGRWRNPSGSSRLSPFKNRRSHPSPGSWIPTVPAWEKRFCTTICGIPWEKILETQRMMAYNSTVVEWDDSAAKEAFENAKSRFYAKMNGLPCQISSLGPDIFIDEIDWNSEIDPQLILELEQAKEPPVRRDGGQTSHMCGILSSDFNKPIPCSGWEDAEGPAGNNIGMSWGDRDEDPWKKAVNDSKDRSFGRRFENSWNCEDSAIRTLACGKEDHGHQNLKVDDSYLWRRRRHWRGVPL
ncbi:uncharacterized protein LOC144706925 [Wolffia australiana]